VKAHPLQSSINQDVSTWVQASSCQPKRGVRITKARWDAGSWCRPTQSQTHNWRLLHPACHSLAAHQHPCYLPRCLITQHVTQGELNNNGGLEVNGYTWMQASHHRPSLQKQSIVTRASAGVCHSPRPAMLVEMVTAPLRPLCATISLSRSTFSGLAFSTWCVGTFRAANACQVARDAGHPWRTPLWQVTA
jgi:hypothetical protein